MRPKTPRAICLDILKRSGNPEAYADDLLSDAFKRYRHLTPLDRAFLTELTYGVLRWRGGLDWSIQQFSKIPFGEIEPDIVNVLRLGLYQILFLTRTPTSAAVNESVELAKKFRGKGGAGFVNAILRSILREEKKVSYPDFNQDPALHISVVHSHPLWLVKRWMNELGVEETLKVCAADNQIPPLTLRTNTLKTSRVNLIRELREQGLSPFAWSILGGRNPSGKSSADFRASLFERRSVYDSGRGFATRDPDTGSRCGEKILDACAAPGTKTTHIAQRMKNEGEIVANDLAYEKLNRIDDNCQRLGVKIVKPRRGDATQAFPFPRGTKFDRILADVPVRVLERSGRTRT